MKTYDVVVVGSGAGAIIVDMVLSEKKKCALIDRGPTGGTCLNLGCIPSKMLIYAADRVVDIQEAAKLGIRAELRGIDFGDIMNRMRKSIVAERDVMRYGLRKAPNLDFYEAEGRFIGDYTLQVGQETVKGDKVFIAAGSRPFIPPIKGLDRVDFLTNESVLRLKERPRSLLIIGGGYIAVEFGHFFAAMGTEVTVVEMGDRLVAGEEPEVSELLLQSLRKRMNVYLSTQAIEVRGGGGRTVLVGLDKTTNKSVEYAADRLLVAVGRRSNADLLALDKTGVTLDQRGYIVVNDYLETSRSNIWAVGDINGRQMFRHMANRQAELAWRNASGDKKEKMDFALTPHAIYSHPQIAAVGLREAEAVKSHRILVGRALYAEVAKGEAMMETDGFAKGIVDADSMEILGFHVIGPYAPEVIQEVVNAVAAKKTADELVYSVHIHPAMSELIERTLSYLEEPGGQHTP